MKYYFPDLEEKDEPLEKSFKSVIDTSNHRLPKVLEIATS